MIKVARKPSSDPVQEKLRQNKDEWNREVKLFIDNLIHFKKTMNGQPSKFFKEKSNIKHPIPGNPTTVISSLANSFQEISQKGNVIIQQQIDYSKKRKQKQIKQSPSSSITTSPTNTSTNLTQQLVSAMEGYELLAMASNSISRFFTRILNPAIGNSSQARIRKYRMSLLRSAAEIEEDLELLQVMIVKSSPDSIFASNKILSKINNNWMFFLTGVNTYKNTLDKKIAPTKKDDKVDKKPVVAPQNLPKDKIVNTEPATKNTDIVIDILNDYKKYASNFLDLDLRKLISLLGFYIAVKDDEKKGILSTQIQDEYKRILQELNSKYNTNGNSFHQIWEMKKSKTSSYHINQLEVLGQKTIKKWLGKIKHQLNPLDKTSAHRLDIYKLCEQILKSLDDIMNSLEKEMNIDHLEISISKISNNLKSIKELTDDLEKTLYGGDFDDSFMNLLESGKITNVGPDLTSQQKEYLKKMIERRRFRGLTNFYQSH